METTTFRYFQIYAHRVVLATTSTYFKALFDDGFLEKNTFRIELHDVDGEAVNTLIDFIYTGQFEITMRNVSYFSVIYVTLSGHYLAV